MASYFEKLTSSGLNLHKQAKDSSQKSSKATPSELSSAIERIEELRELNLKLELDLKCEHDEKADLVGLKVGLENEVLNLREDNERLEFQVEQLRVEKDKIHHVLAKFREGGGGSGGENRGAGLFIATSSGGGSGGFGLMKKFPSLDDLALNSPPAATSPLFTSPSTSPPPGLVRVVTPTSMASGGPLERITEEDETLLESLVMSSNSNSKSEPSTSSSSTSSKQLQQLPQQQHPRIEDLLKKIAFLESENIRLTRKRFVCSKCKRKSNNGRRNPTGGLIFEDEGLVLSAVDDDDDDDEEEDDEDEAYTEQDDDGFNDDDAGAVAGSSRSSSSLAASGAPAKQSSASTDSSPGIVIKTQANSILEIQRKIIEKLERELSVIVDGWEEDQGDDHDGYAEGRRERRKSKEAELSLEVSRMKEELEKRMNDIVWIAANTTKKGEGEGDDEQAP